MELEAYSNKNLQNVLSILDQYKDSDRNDAVSISSDIRIILNNRYKVGGMGVRTARKVTSEVTVCPECGSYKYVKGIDELDGTHYIECRKCWHVELLEVVG